MGCVGKDKYADIMAERARSVGLNVVYQFHDTLPTGRCAVLVTGKNRYVYINSIILDYNIFGRQFRALIAHLYAANAFKVDHFDNDHHWSFIEKAMVHYVSVNDEFFKILRNKILFLF
jgi:adenosine kinase